MTDNEKFIINNLVKRIKDISTVEYKSSVKINNEGYALLIISHHSVVTFLKKVTYSLKLPVLSRKWDSIMEFETRTEKSIRLRKQIPDLYKKGIKQKDICKQLNLSSGCVSQILWGRSKRGD